MKNFSKTIASISLSLLTVGAMAQTQASFSPKQTLNKSHMFVKTVKNSHSSANHKVTSGSMNGMLDYVDGDVNNNGYTFWNGSSGNFTGWSPVLYMNSRYTEKDTTFSPFTSNAANVYTATSCTVVYDTLWDNDAFINTGTGFVQPGAGTVSVDTIWAILGYKNSSNTNDTLIFTFCNVTSSGMPSATTVYAADTEIIAPHTSGVLPGTSLDSNFEVGFTPATPISIPAGAVGGWHFCIHAKVLGSKLDTLGPEYYSAFTQCSGGAYSDSVTTIGPVNGSAPHTNSFVTGCYWYNSAAFGGNGASETFPLSAGVNAGKWVNSGGQQFYGFTPSGCSGFIFYPSVQDIGILCSVSYTDVTGINEVTANGLSVNQNYPNPFNKSTQITYNLVKSSDVVFTVCDMTGRVITNNVYSTVAPGSHEITLSANTFAPGIYFYTLKVNGNEVTKKMVITE